MSREGVRPMRKHDRSGMNAATKEKIAWRTEEIASLYDGWPWEFLHPRTKERICKLRDEIIDLKHEMPIRRE